MQIDKIVTGVSQIAQLTAEFTLGRRDGIRRPRQDQEDYETLLDGARAFHVILHDTAQARAFQTNGEDLILHMVFHRRNLEGLVARQASRTKDTEALTFAQPDRRALSTRDVMLQNADREISTRLPMKGGQRKARRFRDEVRELYDIIDRIWTRDYVEGGQNHKLTIQLNNPLKRFVPGWEYMDIVQMGAKKIRLKQAELSRTSGKWDSYARDIEAVVLFGANFGDIYRPAAPDLLCSTFATLPRNECFLAIRVDAIERLFEEQGSLEDQQMLTASGNTLFGPPNLFQPCYGEHTKGEFCHSQRVLSVLKGNSISGRITQLATGRIHKILPLQRDGAVIIGKCDKTISKESCLSAPISRKNVFQNATATQDSGIMSTIYEQEEQLGSSQNIIDGDCGRPNPDDEVLHKPRGFTPSSTDLTSTVSTSSSGPASGISWNNQGSSVTSVSSGWLEMGSQHIVRSSTTHQEQNDWNCSTSKGKLPANHVSSNYNQGGYQRQVEEHYVSDGSVHNRQTQLHQTQHSMPPPDRRQLRRKPRFGPCD